MAETTTEAERIAMQLNDLINWLLGEKGEFESPPIYLTSALATGRAHHRLKPHETPLYWWREELRRRRDEIVSGSPE